MNDIYKPIESFETNWQDVGQESNFLSVIFDGMFGWVNDSIEGRYTTLDAQRSKMLQENPDLDIRALEDGFALEAEKLNAIRQRQSRGFTIIDINPGLLTLQNYPVTIPYEFLFDGTNFMPAANDSLTKNFRSVPIDIAGNFVKVEYIYENNSNANEGSYFGNKPYAQIKYSEAILNTTIVNGAAVPNEEDLVTGYTAYDFDNFARNKVFLGFNDTISKPHIITRSGDYFNSYFNSLILHLNVGCPKVRITIGFNSEKHEGSSDAPINAKIALMGGARLFKDIDTPLVPFNVTLGDNGFNWFPFGLNGVATPAQQVLSFQTIQNEFKSTNNSGTFGYSLVFITGIDYIVSRSAAAARVYFTINMRVGPVAGGPTGANNFRVHSTNIELTNFDTQEGKNFTYTPSEPIRVVIPNGHRIWIDFYVVSTANATINYNYSYSGYSLGMLRREKFGGIASLLFTTKFITDSTYLTDYNRVESIKDD